MWIEERSAVLLDCGPRTQHGQFCVVRPNDDGTLAVEVYARGHGHRSGRISFTATARRCR
jgi:hypothetical protein